MDFDEQLLYEQCTVRTALYIWNIAMIINGRIEPYYHVFLKMFSIICTDIRYTEYVPTHELLILLRSWRDRNVIYKSSHPSEFFHLLEAMY